MADFGVDVEQGKQWSAASNKGHDTSDQDNNHNSTLDGGGGKVKAQQGNIKDCSTNKIRGSLAHNKNEEDSDYGEVDLMVAVLGQARGAASALIFIELQDEEELISTEEELEQKYALPQLPVTVTPSHSQPGAISVLGISYGGNIQLSDGNNIDGGQWEDGMLLVRNHRENENDNEIGFV